MQNAPEWLPEVEANALAGKIMPCPDGVLRKVLLMQAARSAAPYVYREGSGPCFLSREAIEALRKTAIATAQAAVAAESRVAGDAATPTPPVRA